MFCPKCGKKAPEGSSFCPSCGSPLTEKESTVNVESTPDDSSEPSLAPVPMKKKRSKRPLIAAVAIALVAVGGFMCIRALAAPKEDPHVTKQAESGVEEEAYEDLEVSGIKADDEEGLGRCVKLTVTNNTDEIARNVEITATGDFEIVDEYGDKDKTQLEMKLSCWSPGYGTSGTIVYLMPGENEVVLLAEIGDGTVASYTPENGDEQKFGLEDASDIEIETGDWEQLEQNYDILTPEECDLTIDIAPDGKLSGTITNNTEDRWRKAEVFLRAEDGNGGPGGALLKMGSDDLRTSFSYGDVYAEYVKPGATVDLVSEVGARSEAPRAEAIYVLVEKDV